MQYTLFLTLVKKSTDTSSRYEINTQGSPYYVNSCENTFIYVPIAALYSDHIDTFRKL